MHVFMPRMSKIQLLFVLLLLGRYPSLLCTKPMGQSCSAEAMISQTTVLSQHSLPRDVIFISVSGILKRKETEMCVSCGFVISSTP